VTALALAGALIAGAAAANAAPPQPADLRIAGGAEWRADNSFSLSWTGPPSGTPALAATHYRIRDPRGATIGQSRLSWIGDGIGPLIVPRVPGAYSAEVWFEDAEGDQGPAATAQLRFDDTRPGAVEPQHVPGWIGRTAFPLRIRLGRPAGPVPLSGIRGYAAAIDADPSGAPCADARRCTAAETTLWGGIEGNTLTIVALPEGVSYLHTAAVSGAGVRSATVGRAVLRVDTTDPVVRLAGVPGGWTNRAVRLTANAGDSGSGMAPDGGGSAPFTAIRIDAGAPAQALGATAVATVIDEGVHAVAYYARDAAGNVVDDAGGNGSVNRPPQVWVRIDRGPPNLAFANSQDPRDPELLRVRIADRLSGPDFSRGRLGVRRVGSGDRFETLAAAPAAPGELRARWDSDAYPRGEYEFRAISYDEAGNVAVTTRKRNGAAMVLSNPIKATTALHAGVEGSTRMLPYGRAVLLRGRLTTSAGSPLRGEPVRVVERFAAGPGPEARESVAETGAGGAFCLRLPPGPSRTITVSFDGSPTLTRSNDGPLRLRVRSRVRLDASATTAKIGGTPLVFRGRVAGRIPAGGKTVQLQFRLPGLPWEEFRTVQTDRRGRFRYAYRFSDDDSRGVRFLFRAYAPAQDDWPFEPGGSRPVAVRGR
jgi:hypothetical protein